MDKEATGRRIRAARALGVPTADELARRKRPQPGLTHEDVADRIGLAGYSAKTIGNMERGDTPALRPALDEIARACELPYEFFTVDFAALNGQAEADRTAALEQRLVKIEAVTEMVERDLAPLAGLDAVQLERLVAAAARPQPASKSRTSNRRRRAT